MARHMARLVRNPGCNFYTFNPYDTLSNIIVALEWCKKDAIFNKHFNSIVITFLMQQSIMQFDDLITL